MTKIIDTKLDVAADDDTVFVDGPEGMAGTMTPEAALDSADELVDRAAEALGQKRMREARNNKST